MCIHNYKYSLNKKESGRERERKQKEKSSAKTEWRTFYADQQKKANSGESEQKNDFRTILSTDDRQYSSM